MRTKEPADFKKVLNDNLANNEFYAKLFDKVGSVIDEQIGEPISQLIKARSSTHIRRGDYLTVEGKRGKVGHIERVYATNGDPLDQITLELVNGTTISTVRRALQDRKSLIAGSRFVGFNYYSDFLKDEDFARIQDYICDYWPRTGQPEFIKFIGFIKSLALDMIPLWTRDKGDFATSDDVEISKYDQLEPFSQSMTPVWNNGLWYPTSHVEVFYDAIASETIDDDLILLFYTLAPVHLVLERISGSINIDLSYSLVGVVDLLMVESGYFNLDDQLHTGG